MKGLSVTISLILFSLFLVSCGGGGNSLPSKPPPKPKNPTVTSIIPVDGSSVVPSRSVFVYFDVEMDQLSFTSDSFKLVNKDNIPVIADFDFTIDKGVAFRPRQPLNLIDKYTLTLTTDLKDINGVNLEKTIKSSFTTVEGEWILNPNPVIQKQPFRALERRINVESFKDQVAIQWIESYQDSYGFLYRDVYVKSYNDRWEPKKLVHTTDSNVTSAHYLRMQPDDLFSIFAGNFSELDIYDIKIYSARTGIVSEAARVIESNTIVGFDQSSNGNAIIVLGYPDYYYAKFLIDGVWQTAEPIIVETEINRIGILEDRFKPLIFNDGQAIVFFRRKIGTQSAMYSKSTPFDSASVRVSSRNVELDFDQSFLIDGDNNTAVVLYKYEDGFFWTNKKTAIGWGIEKRITTIPVTAYVFKIIQFPNDQEMVLFTDGDKIKSTLFNSSGWQSAVTINTSPNISEFNASRYYGANGEAGYGINKQSIVVTWFSEAGIHSNQYVDGWKGENTIQPYTNKGYYGWQLPPKIVVTDSGKLHVFYLKSNELFTAVLQ